MDFKEKKNGLQIKNVHSANQKNAHCKQKKSEHCK